MSSGNFFSPAGLSAAATILLTLPGQVQASAENYQYQMKYSADAQSIRPTTVFDDGKATWFVIPSDPKSPPAILIVTPDGKEKLPVRYVTAPNADNTAITIIAYDVAEEWRIRKGAMVVAVRNENFKNGVTVTDHEKKISKEEQKIHDDIAEYLTRLNTVSSQVVINMQHINVHPENNSADFSYARFIKTTKNNAAYVNYEKIQGNLTYRYVEQRKEKNAPQQKPVFQVQSIQFKTVENK
ncbi:TrbG/VirB9 family P-type conjugative transfer protein [Salmonella enterica]